MKRAKHINMPNDEVMNVNRAKRSRVFRYVTSIIFVSKAIPSRQFFYDVILVNRENVRCAVFINGFANYLQLLHVFV
jgi:hypothetical protein